MILSNLGRVLSSGTTPEARWWTLYGRRARRSPMRRRSQFDLVTDYQASIALDFFAEASELLLPSASTAVLLAVIGRCGVPPRAPRLAAGPQPGFGNE